MFRDVMIDDSGFLSVRYDAGDDFVEIMIPGYRFLVRGQIFRKYDPSSMSVQQLRIRLMAHLVPIGLIDFVIKNLRKEIGGYDK